jgi:hypothetical protein
MNRHNLPYPPGMTSVTYLHTEPIPQAALLQTVKSYKIAEPIYVNKQRVQSVSR